MSNRRHALAALLLLAVGCRTVTKAKNVVEKKPEPPVVTVRSEGSLYTRFDDKPERHKAWSVIAGPTVANLQQETQVSGTITGFVGQIYEKNVIAATVRADEGIARKDTPVLVLRGNVEAKGTKAHAVLHCDELLWDPTARLLKAKGAVRYQADGVQAGPFPEVWSTPGLENLGTPDLFLKEGSVSKP